MPQESPRKCFLFIINYLIHLHCIYYNPLVKEFQWYTLCEVAKRAVVIIISSVNFNHEEAAMIERMREIRRRRQRYAKRIRLRAKLAVTTDEREKKAILEKLRKLNWTPE